MIAKLGAWVLHQACHQLSRWLADGHDVWVSVNVSPRELHAPDYVDQVAEALRAHRVPPQRLVLEVTEHAVATDLDELIKRLRALRAHRRADRARRLRRRLLVARPAAPPAGRHPQDRPQPGRRAEPTVDHGLAPLVTLAGGLEPMGRTRAAPRQGGPLVDVVVRLGHRLGLEVIAEGITNQREQTAVVERRVPLRAGLALRLGRAGRAPRGAPRRRHVTGRATGEDQERADR